VSTARDHADVAGEALSAALLMLERTETLMLLSTEPASKERKMFQREVMAPARDAASALEVVHREWLEVS
jgi:hypothetical protein